MDKIKLREVAESIEIGDKVTLGRLDFEFIVEDMVEDPNIGSLSIFGKKDHYPEHGLFTKVTFGVDTPDQGSEIHIRVYEEEDYKDQVDERKYDTLESISVVG